jgi:hypothetical protein
VIFFTSESVPPVGINEPPLPSKRTPSAAAMPQPASFVAEPPSPTMIFLHPRRAASSISSPTPYVVVSRGFFRSPTSGSPGAGRHLDYSRPAVGQYSVKCVKLLKIRALDRHQYLFPAERRKKAVDAPLAAVGYRDRNHLAPGEGRKDFSAANFAVLGRGKGTLE